MRYKMADFIVVLLTVVTCFMVDVGSCNTFCEGQDREKIVQALLGESHWETLAGFLGVGDGVLEGIWAHCGTRGSVSATCYRRQLVKHYCDRMAQTCRQIASDMANILEHNMDNKRLAKNLRQLFNIDSDGDHQPTDGSPPTDSTTPPPPHRDDNSQPSSWPYDRQSLGVWLTDNWVSLSLAVVIVISSVWLLGYRRNRQHLKRKRESTAAEKLLNTANDVAKKVSKKVSSKKSSQERSKKKTVTEKTAMDKELDDKDLREILELLVGVNKNWKELGLQLGLREATLDGIEANHRDVEKYKMNMISKWLKWVDIDYKPTWQHLADALRHSTVQHGPIAQAIEDKYSIILLD